MFLKDENMILMTTTTSSEPSPWIENDPIIIAIVVMAVIGLTVSLIAVSLILVAIFYFGIRAMKNIFHLIVVQETENNESQPLLNESVQRTTNYSRCKEAIPP